MNKNNSLTLLQSGLESAAQTRWPDCKLISFEDPSDDACSMVLEIADLSLMIISKKPKLRSKLNWDLGSISKESLQAILQALKLKRDIQLVDYSSRRQFDQKKSKQHIATSVTLAKKAVAMKWDKIFPNDPLPESFQWTIDKQEVKKRKDCLVVFHHLKNGRAKQTNEYQLPLKNISMAIYESTLAFNTFPFNIPHSHKIIENKEVTYDRPLSQWQDHVDQKGLLENSTVKNKKCAKCKTQYFDTSSQDYCYQCMIGEQVVTEKKAIALCKQAEKLSKLSEWKETAAKMKALQQQWQQLKNISRDKSDSLYERFRAATQTFFDRQQAFFDKLNGEREGNQAKAEKLIKAAKLSVKNKDPRQAREEIIELQQKWKSVNPLPQAHADALWSDFRATCQSVFTK